MDENQTEYFNREQDAKQRHFVTHFEKGISIKPSHHLFFRHWLEVIDIQSTCNQCRSCIGRYQFRVEVRCYRQLVAGEVKEIRKFPGRAAPVARVGQPRIGISQFIEEWLAHRINCRQSLGRGVLQKG